MDFDQTLWQPPWCQGFCLQPLGSFLTTLGILSQAVDQMETIKLFAGKKKVIGVQQIQVLIFGTFWNFFSEYFGSVIG